MLSQLRCACRDVTGFLKHNHQNIVKYAFKDSLNKAECSLSTLVGQAKGNTMPSASIINQANNALVPTNSVLLQSVRTKVRVYYKGSAWKRYNKHNIEKRLTSPGGIEVLWRRVLKGRFQLATYERILPNTTNSKILPPHHFKYRAHPITKRKLPNRELL